ncbi:MAG TPA: restriction endonuclease subunit S, partial [Ignavibacteriaceae bacterium]|nr:restriction endonuclease subunit S [Ignavibacteriaceae bacterium]
QLNQRSIPEHWSWVKLGDVIGKDGVFVDGDWVESKDQDPNGEVRLIQLADIGEIEFRNKSDRYLTYNKALELNCTFLDKGDLLIARMPDPLGRACIFPLKGKEKFVTVVDVAIIRVDEKKVDNDFLCYIINAPQSRNNISSLQSGSTRKRISRKNLGTINFPLPPLAEQKKIVEKIEELFSGLDNGVASLKKAKEQIKLYRQSVLAFAFSGKLVREVSNRRLAVGKSEMLKAAEPKGDYNKSHPVCLWRIISGSEKLKQVPQRNGQLDDNGLPEGWSFIKIRDISDDMMIGIVKSAKEQFTDKRGVPYIKMNNVSMDGTVDVNDVVNVEVNKQEMEKFKLKKGDILFNTRNSYELVGKTGIVKDDKIKRVYNNNLLRIRVKKDFNPDFINYQMNSYYFREKLKAGKRATTNICAIYQTDLFSMELNVPPLNQQHQIVSEIEKRFSEADNLEKAIDDSLAKSELLRQSILSQAFSGKLV